MTQSLITKRCFGQWFTIALVIWVALALPSIPGEALGGDTDDHIENPGTAAVRVLNFPKDVSLGVIIATEDGLHGRMKARQEVYPARGRVVIPKGLFVTFRANKEFFKNPQLIAGLPANAIDCLELQLISMEDSEDTLCDRALGHIGHLKGLRDLILDKSEVTDEGMKQIAGLTNLEYISAFLTPLRGTFLKDLRGLKKLQRLNLPSDALFEEELKYLPAYPLLQNLVLRRTSLTDKGMKYIALCPKLKVLDVAKNPGVGDGAIQYIKPLKSLQSLSVAETSISSQGLLQLKGLNLKKLILTDAKFSKSQLSVLHSTFPHAVFYFHGGIENVDDFDRTMYAPMTRQRKF